MMSAGSTLHHEKSRTNNPASRLTDGRTDLQDEGDVELLLVEDFEPSKQELAKVFLLNAHVVLNEINKSTKQDPSEIRARLSLL